MKSALRVLISGKVQGVFFRATTRDMAASLSLNGYVRNTENGKVEAVFQGKKEDVLRMLEFCRRGPPGSLVKEVISDWIDTEEELAGFEIRY